MKTKRTRKLAAAFLLFATLGLPAFTARGGSPFLNGSSFIKGANLPWMDGDFYNDIAVNPHYPDWGCGYSSMDMNRYLADLHSMGVTVVRFWLNTDDQGCALEANGYVTNMCCNCPVFPASPIGLKPRPIWQAGSPFPPMS